MEETHLSETLLAILRDKAQERQISYHFVSSPQCDPVNNICICAGPPGTYGTPWDPSYCSGTSPAIPVPPGTPPVAVPGCRLDFTVSGMKLAKLELQP